MNAGNMLTKIIKQLSGFGGRLTTVEEKLTELQTSACKATSNYSKAGLA